MQVECGSSRELALDPTLNIYLSGTGMEQDIPEECSGARVGWHCAHGFLSPLPPWLPLCPSPCKGAGASRETSAVLGRESLP